MSLPNYIINLPELKLILESFISDSDDDNKIMKSKGFMIKSEAYSEDVIVWRLDEEVDITGIRFGQEEIRNMGYEDNFDIIVGDEVIMDNIYYKELNEYKSFRNAMKVEEGTVVKIINRNNSGQQKEVKFDIDYKAWK